MEREPGGKVRGEGKTGKNQTLKKGRRNQFLKNSKKKQKRPLDSMGERADISDRRPE